MRPHLIARPHWLNLDNLGPHVGKHLPAHRPRNHLRELNHNQIVKCFAAQARTSQKGNRDYNPKFPTPRNPNISTFFLFLFLSFPLRHLERKPLESKDLREAMLLLFRSVIPNEAE